IPRGSRRLLSAKMMPFYGRNAARTGMGGLAWLLPFETDTREMALVAKHAPQLAPHLSIVAPVAPAPFRITPSPSRLHRLERLASHQVTAKGGGEHEQDIGRQMRQILIPSLIFAPASSDLPAEHHKLLDRRLPPWIIHRKAIPLLFQPGHFRFEMVDLSSRPSLCAIKGASVQKEWPPHLVPIQIN